jgi:hypothetical protein
MTYGRQCKDIRRVKEVIWLLLSLLAIAGYAHAGEQETLDQQQAVTQQYRTEMADFTQTVRIAKKTAPLRQRIEGKIPIEPREITPAMMANTDKPTPEEREAILESTAITLKYQPMSLQIMRRYNVPSTMISLIEAFYTQGTLLNLQLYHGTVTYGEFSTKARQLSSQYQSDVAQLTSLLEKQESEAHMQALQLAIQREQQALSELQLYNQFLQTLQRDNPTIRCNQVGGFTYCNH